MAATLPDLLRECSSGIDAAYAAKYLHAVPRAVEVNRAQYLCEQCRGKRVLSLGASGPIEVDIAEVAATYRAVDRVRQDDHTVIIDLDDTPERLRDEAADIDIVLCGEVLEHLSNPGRLLDAVRQLGVPLLVTVPNAFTEVGGQWIRKGRENVNVEHVAYYSYHTLKTLLMRHGFEIVDFAWYNGKPLLAEGLVFFAR